MGALALVDNAKSLDLIRRTVARDCDASEFDTFVHICRAVRLDPLRRQIYAFVFNKNDARYRQMTVVTAIGGYRSIAERTGNYRPDNRAPRFEYSEAAKDAKTNPLGIVKAEVSVFKHSHGEWFECVAEAYWEEYVPLKDGVIDSKKTGWVKSPRNQIAKCAEAAVLRKAWPDDFAGLEVEEETDRRDSLELSASELADEGAAAKRFELIGGANALTVDWCDGQALSREPVGTFGDKVLAFIQENREAPMTVRMFHNRNTAALQEYWAKDKSGALELKKAFEAIDHLEAAE